MFYDFRSIVLPYCLERQENGAWVVLNREYKPIGFFTGRFINYCDHPIALMLPDIDAKLEAELDCEERSGEGRIYLYNDGCIPTQSQRDMDLYLQRLATLAKLQTPEGCH